MTEIAGGRAHRYSANLPENRESLPENSYLLLLGLEPLDTPRVVELVQSGFSSQQLERFRESTGLSNARIAELVNIKPRTLSRRKKEGYLSAEESDRLLRAARVFGEALRLFEGDREAARQWLCAPQVALGGAIPLEMAETDIGSREVEALIGRLEYGVFS